MNFDFGMLAPLVFAGLAIAFLIGLLALALLFLTFAFALILLTLLFRAFGSMRAVLARIRLISTTALLAATARLILLFPILVLLLHVSPFQMFSPSIRGQ